MSCCTVSKEIFMHEQHRRDKDPYLFRPARSFSFFVLFTLLLLLAACGGSDNTSVPDAHQLISKAQAAIKAVTAYHFKLTTDHPGTGATLTILKAEGDIAVPDKLKTNA